MCPTTCKSKRPDTANDISFQIPDIADLKDLAHISVPIMQIQIHVENAIEHGLRNKVEPGFVKISIMDQNEYIIITVEDDGIGRQKARSQHSQGTQQGTAMLKELHALLNKHNHFKISSQYHDLHLKDEEGKSMGTLVEIQIPKSFNYEF